MSFSCDFLRTGVGGLQFPGVQNEAEGSLLQTQTCRVLHQAH